MAVIKFFKGLLNLSLYTLNLAVGVIFLLLAFLVSLLIGQKKMQFIYYYLAEGWIKVNNIIFKYLTNTQISVDWPQTYNLSRQEFYLVIANHQGWTDILILLQLFNGRIPLLKFFAKKQLFWVPFLGQACWIYGFPYLHRHSPAELKKHPEWRKKDIQAAKKACEKFKQEPGSLMIFVEGTRFTPEKHAKQQSFYTYLLKPKTGGLAIALNTMEDRIKKIIDVTLIYPKKGSHTFWDYCCGNIEKIQVIIKVIPVPSELRGDTENDPEFRQHFQKFIHQIWLEKDDLIKQVYNNAEQQ